MQDSGHITIFTIGHSTHSLEEFVILLRSFGVGRVVDIRTIPRSRHNPQFERRLLAGSLRNRRIGYRHMKELGGLRHSRRDSINLGWRNLSFRGFADYMQTEAFAKALDELILLAHDRPTALMCAEAVPWRCHRYLISDALVLRGFTVEHIMAPGVSRTHSLHPLAVVNGDSITYPAATSPTTGTSPTVSPAPPIVCPSPAGECLSRTREDIRRDGKADVLSTS